jgi:hypothetical protein
MQPRFSPIEERYLYLGSTIPESEISFTRLLIFCQHTVSTHAENSAPNSTHIFPSPRSSRGASSSSACFSSTLSSLFNRDAFSVLSKAVLYGVCAGASKFRGGRRMPRGSDGTTALTDEMNVAESPAAFLMSSYLEESICLVVWLI